MIFPTLSLLLASSLVAALPIQKRSVLPRLGGVNIAGLDFGMTTWGWSGSFAAPDVSQIAHFAALGANAFRIPFGWQYLQPTLGGELDASFAATLDTYVQAALKTGGYAILDLHNYARLNSGVVGVDGPSNAQFADFWSRLAKKYASQPNVIFALMNEPHDLADFGSFVTSLQTAVTAIRAAGATTQSILLPGNDWTHAASMISTNGPQLLTIKDTTSDSSRLLIDIHQYLDSDGSGTSTTCTTDNVALFTQLSAWLASVGRQAIVSETGAGNNAGCITAFGSQLKYIAANPLTIAGFTVWSAGAFATSYELSIVPNSDGSDNELVKQAIQPYFPGSKGVATTVAAVTSAAVTSVKPTTSSIATIIAIKTTAATTSAVVVTSVKATTSSVPTTTAIKTSAVVTSAVPTKSSVVVTSAAAIPTTSSVVVKPTTSSVTLTTTSVAPPAETTKASSIVLVVVPSSTSVSVKAPVATSIAVVPTSSSVQVATSAVVAPTSALPISSTITEVILPTTVTSSAASPVATGSSPDLGLQTYTGHLGDIYAIPVTVGGRGYLIGNESVSSGELYTALSKSCDKQHNLCANAANQGRNLVYTVGDCDAQNNACKAAISV